jgi:hypothetical protein
VTLSFIYVRILKKTNLVTSLYYLFGLWVTMRLENKIKGIIIIISLTLPYCRSMYKGGVLNMLYIKPVSCTIF